MARPRNRPLAMVALAILMVAVCSAGAASAQLYPDDTEAPMVLGFTIHPGRVNTGIGPKEVIIGAWLVDFGSGVSGSGDAQVQFASPSGTSFARAIFYHGVPDKPDALMDGTVYHGLWQVSLTLPENAEEGIWELEDLFLIDQAGNYQVFVANDMAAFGFGTTFEVSNDSRTLWIPAILTKPPAPTPTPTPEPTVPIGVPPVPPE